MKLTPRLTNEPLFPAVCVTVFPKMAFPLAVFCCLLFVSLYCCTGLPRRLDRSKRALDDDDIITALQMYETQMTRLQRKIAQQEATIKAQRRQIDDIRYYLRAKSDDYEKDNLEGLIISRTDSVKQPLKLLSLDNLVLAVNDHEKRQQDLRKALEKPNEVMGDIHRRVLDNRLVCRDTHTDWKERAGGNIRQLARHFVKCNENELLQRLRLKRDGGAFNSKVRYEYRCCHLSMKDNWQSPDDM